MIIAISGKINSGKDTACRIIQYLMRDKTQFRSGMWSKDSFISGSNAKAIKYLEENSKFQRNDFGDKMKDIVCSILGCTREMLEDEEYRNSYLGREWDVYDLGNGKIVARDFYKNKNQNDHIICEQRFLRKMTPRLFMQLVGTNCFRNIIHPNTWVNSLFLKYRALNGGSYNGTVIDYTDSKFPNWIISDLRHNNELEACQKRNALIIRLERNTELRHPELWAKFQNSKFDSWDDFLVDCNKFDVVYHQSEIELDGVQFKNVVNNNSNIENLFYGIRAVLIDNGLL